MGLGVAALNTNQFRPLAGVPPFPATSADNGLSVDPGTGHIVLGNDAGGTAATLLSNREIPVDIFTIKLIDALGNSNEISGNAMLISNFSGNSFTIEADPTAAFFQLLSDINIGQAPEMVLQNNVTPDIHIKNTLAGLSVLAQSKEMLSLDSIAKLYQLGDVSAVANGSVFAIDDTAGVFAIGNTAANAAVMINGTPGFTGNVTPVNSISVIGGIVVNVT